MSNGKALFPVVSNLQSHWLIKTRTWQRNDGARRQQNENGNFVQMDGNFSFNRRESGVTAVKGLSFVPENFRLNRAYHLHFNLVKPKILAK